MRHPPAADRVRPELLLLPGGAGAGEAGPGGAGGCQAGAGEGAGREGRTGAGARGVQLAGLQKHLQFGGSGKRKLIF